ncbi:MAG: ATP-dependent Clp protease ATP-binding subunit [Proteobacteria bacterium]|nr:MAG: ATP-dependent Clp protease ATP-binding subunit [Pseudomonadota bacterium]
MLNANCIIIGTSNLGSEVLSERRSPIGIGASVNEWSQDDSAKEVLKIVKNYLRPEFINRLDEIIIFNKLDRTQFEKIADILITDLQSRLKKLRVKLDFPAEARRILVEKIDTAHFGARPLKRKLEEIVENPISTLLIQDRRDTEKTAHVTPNGEDLAVSLS